MSQYAHMPSQLNRCVMDSRGRRMSARKEYYACLIGAPYTVCRHWTEEFMDQLDGCADDAARRLLLNASPRAFAQISEVGC